MKSALLLFASLLVLGLGACKAENDESLIITKFVDLTAAACVVTPQATVTIPSGVLDVGLLTGLNGGGYIAAPVVLNNLVERATMGSPERDGIQVTGVDVQLELPPALVSLVPPAQRTFYVPAAGGYITPTSQLGLAPTVLPAQIVRQLSSGVQASAQLVLVSMRAVGTRAAGTLTSAYVPFPITVCNGCLTINAGKCPIPAAQLQATGCFPWQDRLVSCCTDAGGNVLCGKAAPTM